MRAKQNGRNASQKFFIGGAWDGFCNRDKKSPGGPKAIAEFLLIMLGDLKMTRGDKVDLAPIYPRPRLPKLSPRGAVLVSLGQRWRRLLLRRPSSVERGYARTSCPIRSRASVQCNPSGCDGFTDEELWLVG